MHYLSFIPQAKTQSREIHVLISILQTDDIILANMSMDIRLYTRKQMSGRYLDIDYRDMCYHRQTYTDTIQLPLYHHRTFLVHLLLI
jgi:hypothetical protein